MNKKSLNGGCSKLSVTLEFYDMLFMCSLAGGYWHSTPESPTALSAVGCILGNVVVRF